MLDISPTTKKIVNRIALGALVLGGIGIIATGGDLGGAMDTASAIVMAVGALAGLIREWIMK